MLLIHFNLKSHHLNLLKQDKDKKKNEYKRNQQSSFHSSQRDQMNCSFQFPLGPGPVFSEIKTAALCASDKDDSVCRPAT